ncbi:hypothetical protein [Cumulibacter manganitolerans]|uniref:hypothetical protein n=1 Tax=Cumulibacter manganitolerans TaxID=1884992 RepID=UPI001297A531|nr:hypothetical protein [Cumulibacter manganitolerans]
MTPTPRRALAAAATAALLLTAAACSKATEGKASPSGAGSSTTSVSAGSSSSDSESSAPASSESGPSGGDIEAIDGSLSFTLPAGYQDAIDKINVPGAVAAVVDPASDAGFPTHIVIAKQSATGDLDTMFDSVRKQIEKKFSIKTEDANPPVDDIDGEPLKAFTTPEYTDAGKNITSALFMTEHDGSFYSFTTNTLPDNAGDAADAMVALVESVKWA